MNEVWKKTCVIAGCAVLILSAAITLLSPFVTQVIGMTAGSEGIRDVSVLFARLRFIAPVGYLLLAAGYLKDYRNTAIAAILAAAALFAPPLLSFSSGYVSGALIIGVIVINFLIMLTGILFYLSLYRILPQGLAIFSLAMMAIQIVATVISTVFSTIIYTMAFQQLGEILSVIGLINNIISMGQSIAAIAFLICLIIVTARNLYKRKAVLTAA